LILKSPLVDAGVCSLGSVKLHYAGPVMCPAKQCITWP